MRDQIADYTFSSDAHVLTLNTVSLIFLPSAKERTAGPELGNATSPTNLQTDENLHRTQQHLQTPRDETHQPSSTSDSNRSQTNLRDPQLLPPESVEIPEPLGTEIILCTERDPPARRKNPPLKAIQIIDPRPLPPKKTHANLPELPAAHIYSYISSDHDYCTPLDRALSPTTQGSSPAAESKNQTSTDASFRALSSSAKSVPQNPPGELRTGPEASLPSEKNLLLSDIPAKEKDCDTAEQKTPQCSLPTPPPSPPVRGREKRRYRRRSPRSSSSSCSSSSSSSSSSRSPKRQK